MLALVAVASVLARFLAPAASSAVPALVRSEELVGANAWLGTALNLQVAFGGLLGGLLGAVVVSLARSVRDELGFVARHAVARAVILTLFAGGVRRRDVGLRVRHARCLARAHPVGAAGLGASGVLGEWFLTAAGTLATGLAPEVAAAVGAQWLGGVGNGVGNIGGDTLIQRSVPPSMLGRVFGLTKTAAFVGSGLAYAIGGVLVDLMSPRAVFVAASAGVRAASIGGTFLLPRDEGSVPGVGIQRGHRGRDRTDGA